MKNTDHIDFCSHNVVGVYCMNKNIFLADNYIRSDEHEDGSLEEWVTLLIDAWLHCITWDD